MKKNKMMRTASALLVATLLSTSIIAGTFAKYTTSTTGSDKARVAYWGFNQAASTTIDLFDDSYTNVKSGNSDNVVAPGTEKTTTFAFGYDTKSDAEGTAIANAPEVAYTLTVNAEVTGSYTSLDNNPDFKWTLKKGDQDAVEYSTVKELTDAIKALSGDASGSKQYTAGQLPTNFTAADETYTVGWKWAFDDANKTVAQDKTDTDMGNAATLDNINLTITITATQVD